MSTMVTKLINKKLLNVTLVVPMNQEIIMTNDTEINQKYLRR